MNVNKLMYFSTGDGANASGEAYTAPVNKLYSIQPVSATALDLIFHKGDKDSITSFDSVRLTITSGTHKTVVDAINNAITSVGKNMIVVCDSDNSNFVNANITDCTIYLGKSDVAFNTQNITGTAKTTITVASGSFDSLLLASVSASTDAVVNLYLASQVGTAITATDVVAAENQVVSTGSVTLVVDNGSGSASDAANDEFLNERVYKSDGTFFGVCTTVDSTEEITFSGGVENTITNNDILYTGSRYHILKAVQIEVGTTLKLEPDELNFDNDNYTLYITLTAGSIDIITRQ